MTSVKNLTIAYWISTILIFLFEGVIPALTGQSDLAKEGIRNLGYPEYFGSALVIFKIIGAIILIAPIRNIRIKEWAYAGFTFNFLFAALSHFVVDGFHFQSFFPLIVLIILAVSYFAYHNLNRIRSLQGVV